MKIYICPNCKEKHIYDGMIKHLCTRCAYPIIVDECESFSVEKEPFEKCPFCDKKYDTKVTKCTFCGFGLESFDEVDELIEYHKSEQQKQEQQLEYELNNPYVPKCQLANPQTSKRFLVEQKC